MKLDINYAAQFVTTIISIISTLILSIDKPWRKWGYPIGLASQPFWFYIIVSNKLWGLLPLTCWFTFTWVLGVYNFVIAPHYRDRKVNEVQTSAERR